MNSAVTLTKHVLCLLLLSKKGGRLAYTSPEKTIN